MTECIHSTALNRPALTAVAAGGGGWVVVVVGATTDTVMGRAWDQVRRSLGPGTYWSSRAQELSATCSSISLGAMCCTRAWSTIAP